MTSNKSENHKVSPPPGRSPFVDNSGHIDPEHAQRLRRLSAGNPNAEEEDHAFIDHHRTLVDMAESFGEDSVVHMTTGEQETSLNGDLAPTPGRSNFNEGDLDSSLWERELAADAEDDDALDDGATLAERAIGEQPGEAPDEDELAEAIDEDDELLRDQ